MALDRVARSLLMSELLSDLWLPLNYGFKTKATVNYPHERMQLSPRFKGEYAQRRCLHAEERCIACKLCEAVCPAFCIFIGSEARDDGSHRATRNDMIVCIEGGPCEESCPVDAIVMGPDLEFATETREDVLYKKEKLLSNGDRWESLLAKRFELDVPYR